MAISKHELKYVDSWASKIPMPGKAYSMAVLNEIDDCFKIYNEKYKDKEYSIMFSNSEEIEFEILSKNLCHMLGIDYKNIMGDYFLNYRANAFGTRADLTSYELLQLIIKNKEKVAEQDNNPNVQANAINYYKSAIKCAILKKLSDFEKFNFIAINKEQEEGSGDKQKLLFVPSNEALVPYFFMGIKQGDDQIGKDKYFVSTLLAPEVPKIFFAGREAVIPTQIIINTEKYLNKIEATPEEKIQLLTIYKNIVNMYRIEYNLNINGDYEAMLNSLSNQRTIK